MRQTQEMLYSVQTAFVMINCETGQENTVVEQLREVKGVKEVIRTSGPHDILTSIETPTVEELKNLIESNIRKIPHIQATTTLVKSRP